jgi:proteasome lid subunit RPN8/RPN11
MIQKAAKPDVRQLAEQNLPQAPFPSDGAQDFRVSFAPDVHAEIWRHAGEDVSVEICGVLVGEWERDADGPFVVIRHSIRAAAAASKFAEVTFTHDSWAQINEVMDSKYSDLKIVGWYHTHPDFGIFLSDRDVFIQQSFFSEPGQVAHVVDPIRKTEGVFLWRDGKPTLAPHYWVGSAILAERERESSREDAGPDSGALPAPSASPIPADQATSPVGPWNSWLSLALVFLLGYLISGFLSQRRSDWEREMMFEGMVKHYSMWKFLRPDLKRELGVVDSALGEVTTRVGSLAGEHLKLIDQKEAAAEKKLQWGQLLGGLQATRRSLDGIGQRYCLTDKEESAVERIMSSFLKQAERDKESKSAAAPTSGTPAAGDNQTAPDKPASAEKPASADKPSTANPPPGGGKG